ncbi:MAG: hypothetical protein ABJK28_07050 [Algibacter sp.]
MYKIIIALFWIQLFSCKSPEKKTIIADLHLEEAPVNVISNDVKIIDSLKVHINFKPKGDYTLIKSGIIIDRAFFKTLFKTNPEKAIDSASSYLYSKLINEIVPHWYGTPWDFNGHTNIPNKGEIACGYFVSTTLKHLGFNLNRYKMAQQSGLIEAQVLQEKLNLKIYRNHSYGVLKTKLNQVYDDGVYFVGLDNHVGYVLIIDKEFYFLHSSYYDDKVMIELAKESPCFDSNIYVFAEITTNKDLVKHWIFNDLLVVPAN